MAINLEKGQRIEVNLKTVTLGLGWDPNMSSGKNFDLDASVFCLNNLKKLPQDEYFVFYNNKYSPDGAVEGADDDRTGSTNEQENEQDDEEIKIDLDKVDAKISEIRCVVTIHKGIENKQNFGQVRNSYIRIVDNTTNTEIAKYELEEDFSIETAIEFGRLYRKNGGWKFEAIGEGYKEDLGFFVSKYK